MAYYGSINSEAGKIIIDTPSQQEAREGPHSLCELHTWL